MNTNNSDAPTTVEEMKQRMEAAAGAVLERERAYHSRCREWARRNA